MFILPSALFTFCMTPFVFLTIALFRCFYLSHKEGNGPRFGLFWFLDMFCKHLDFCPLFLILHSVGNIPYLNGLKICKKSWNSANTLLANS